MISITRTAVALAFIAGTTAYAGPGPNQMNPGNTSPPRQETTMEEIEGGTTHLARETLRGSRRIARETWTDSKRVASDTWTESKKVARTAVHSPAIAYDAMRGERYETASRGESHRQQIALTGHKVKSHQTNSQTGKMEPAPNAPPI